LNKNGKFCSVVVKTIICVHELFVFMLSDAELKEILIRQRDNLLKKNYGVERDVLKGYQTKVGSSSCSSYYWVKA